MYVCVCVCMCVCVCVSVVMYVYISNRIYIHTINSNLLLICSELSKICKYT